MLLRFHQESEFKCHNPVVTKLTPALPPPPPLQLLEGHVHIKEYFKGFLFSEVSAWIIMSCYIFVGKGLQSTQAQTIFKGTGMVFCSFTFSS